jgi:hypothetical protein
MLNMYSKDVLKTWKIRINKSLFSIAVLPYKITQEDVASRIKKANGVFVQLYPVWRNHNISKRVKIQM